MKRAGLVACGLLSLALAASPAAATVVVTSDYGSDTFVSESGSFSLDPGTYALTLSFTQPVSDLFGFVSKTTTTEFTCDLGAGEFDCGGNDVPTELLFEIVNSQLYQLTLVVNSPATVLTPDGLVVRTEQFDTCCTFEFDFVSGPAGAYTLAYSAIPEPATWLAMFVGFGAMGVAMRRRRRLVRLVAREP